jgi:hypothetical protein
VPRISFFYGIVVTMYRTFTRIGQRPAQRHRIGTAHVPLAHTVEVCARQPVCMSEHVFVGHRRNSLPRPQPFRGRRGSQTVADGRA